MNAGRAESIRARLLNLAKSSGQDFNLMLNHYAVERWLYRLSVSDQRERFCLKGAMLFHLWFDAPHRPTRDADFLGFGAIDADALTTAIKSISMLEIDDGMVFDPGSVTVEAIREEARYGGLRAMVKGRLGNAKCQLQLDVGYGDAVTPGAQDVDFPTLLEDVPIPRLKVYPRETAVAEKLEAIALLGINNSRMKDFYDLRALVKEGAIDRGVLAQAIAATFARRATEIPEGLPLGLTAAFAENPEKQQQWLAFLRKNGLGNAPLAEVVDELGAYFAAPLKSAFELRASAEREIR